MIDDGVVTFVCILNFNILVSPTILTLADEAQSLFHRGGETYYRNDSQPICMDVNFAFPPFL